LPGKKALNRTRKMPVLVEKRTKLRYD